MVQKHALICAGADWLKDGTISSCLRLKGIVLAGEERRERCKVELGFLSNGGCLDRSAGHSSSNKSVLSQRATESHFYT